MDDDSLRDSWTWMDEDLRLDVVGSPLDMPDCVWDDFFDNDAVVRSLFPPAPLAAHLKDGDPLAFPFEQQDSPDYNPAPLKRRRILELNEDNLMDISSCLPEPQEITTDFLVEVCEDMQPVDPSSSSSVWYMTNEDSLSSVEDAVEQSSEGWRINCISDSDASDVQDLVLCPVNPPVIAGTSENKAGRDCGRQKSAGFMPQTRHTSSSASSALSNVAHHKLIHSRGNVRNKQFQHGLMATSPHVKEPSKDCSSSRDCTIPVLAYPFALVKPIGIQGDITLQDINQRINSGPSSVNARSEQPRSTSSSPYSGKSVLALTKIYTEGKGTITIMRTKG